MNFHMTSSGLDDRPLIQFTQTFGGNARTLLAATGWVTYMVGMDRCIVQFLASDTNRVEYQAYQNEFQKLDPLSPEACLADEQRVASLRQRMSCVSEDHRVYQSRFLDRHGIVDAVEIFLRSDASVILGCSLLRHQDAPCFSGDDIAKAHALRAIGDLALAHAFPSCPTSSGVIAQRFPTLTAREATLVGLVAEGLSNKQVGHTLCISLPTVKTHLLHVFRKMGVGSRTELVSRVLGRQ